jgi:uncharacterized protein YdhG (YjbR/CyaY superfamily)
MPAKKPSAETTKASKKPRLSDAEIVASFMDNLQYPLKNEVEELRKIIKSTEKNISERIKWNAPSYFTTADFLTFNLRSAEYVLLIFHHITIVDIHSPLLEGDYKDRRMVYFRDSASIKKGKEELKRIITEMTIKLAP